MAHESYVYYEYHIDNKPIKGYSPKTFDIDSEVAPKYIKSPSQHLTVVHGYTWNGYLPTDPQGMATGKPETGLTIQHRMDVSIVPLMKQFLTSKTLNIGLLLLSEGGYNRSESDKRDSDEHHFFTFLMAQARIIDIDIARTGDDIVSMSFKSAALFFQDHDVSGTLGETSWRNPGAKQVQFETIWNEKKAG